MNKLVWEEYKTEDNCICDADASARQTCTILTETVCLASRAATCGFVCLLEGDVYQLGVTLDLCAEILQRRSQAEDTDVPFYIYDYFLSI